MGCTSSKTSNPTAKKDPKEDTNKEVKNEANKEEIVSNAAPADTTSKDAAESSSSTSPSKVLVLRVSPLGEYSNSNKIIDKFLEAYKKNFPNDEVVEKDISDGSKLPTYNAKRVMAKFATYGGDENAVAEDGKEEWAVTKELAKEFGTFDKVVIGNPMWNFSIAYQLKKYFDHVIQPHISFDPATFSGKYTHMTALLVNSSGGDVFDGPMDYNLPLLKTMLGFIGIADIKEITIGNTANAETTAAALEEKFKEAEKIAAEFTLNSSATPYAGLKRDLTPSSEEVPNGKKVLHVISSPLGDWSTSTTVAKNFLEEYKKQVPEAEVTTLDLTQDELAPFSALRVQAKFAPFLNQEIQGAAKEEWDYTLKLINEFKEYDTYVFSVATWNYGVPNQLKLYIDHLVQPFQTFDPQTYAGLLNGKKAYVITAAGGPTLGGEKDFASTYMNFALTFIGLKDIKHVNINGTADQSKKEEILAEGTKEAVALL